MYSAILFLPLIGFLIAGLFGRAIGAKASEYVTSGLVILAALLSWVAFFGFWLGGSELQIVDLFRWIDTGDLKVAWSIRVDTLTAVMLVVVTTVSALVHMYSLGYMSHDPQPQRFFSYLSLFTFAMLMLVTADNLVQMFFGWEGVGLASYLLIGFWYKKPSANAAAIKAFVVNRVGDFGFALGIFATFMVFGSHRVRHHLRAAPEQARQDHDLPELGSGRDDRHLPAAVHGGDGQVGAVPAAHLAAGRHGRPDAGVRAHPRRHHGHGRRVPGGAHVAVDRAVDDRTCGGDGNRRHHGHLRRNRRPRAERHQARHRLFDLFAAWLHVRRAWGRGLWYRHLPPVHPRLLQGAAVPRRRARSSTPCRTSRTCATWAAWQPPEGDLGHDARHAGADRLSVHRIWLFLEGRHHRKRVCRLMAAPTDDGLLAAGDRGASPRSIRGG
jgi:hypothetical protein